MLGLDVTVRRGPETRVFEAFANQSRNKTQAVCLSRSGHPQLRPCHDHGGRRGADRQHAGDGGLDGRRPWPGRLLQPGAGDQTRLYQLTAEVTPVDGAATLQFVPALRSSPADGAEVEIASPGVLLRAASDVPPTLRADRMLLRIDAVEHL